jgi:hypothetical protein
LENIVLIWDSLLHANLARRQGHYSNHFSDNINHMLPMFDRVDGIVVNVYKRPFDTIQFFQRALQRFP